MSKPSLDSLIKQGEGPQLEFKRTLSSAHRIARTLTAFANTSGGTLLIGVADDGKLVGVASEMAEIQTLERAANDLIEPPLLVSYETRRQDGKLLLVVQIGLSDEKPHKALNEQGHWLIYVRQRDKSVPTDKFMSDGMPIDPKLLQTPMVKNLLLYLRKTDTITADRTAKLVNISLYRAKKLLNDLTAQGLLLFVDQPRPARYSLKK